MLIPIKWLKEYIKTDLSNEQIAQVLTLGGLTIEEIKNDVMDAEVTSNRSDWLSIYGVAREFCALTNSELLPLEKPELKIKNEKLLNITYDKDLVTRFTAYIIKDIKVGESPDWLKSKLTSVGIRSINNIVDITNFIMIKTGQPLHAFDLDKLSGEFIIRRGKKGEKVTTLDQIERSVNEDVIVAENQNQLVDLVGIMGGALSDTTQNTQNIMIQAAVFPPSLIRKSAKTIKYTTEASYRYERGVDFEKNKQYLDLAAELILQLAGGEITELIDIKNEEIKPKDISWKLSNATSLLGIDLDEKIVLNNLKNLGIQTTKKDDNYISSSPSWRFDLKIKEDIIEEIGRFYPVDKMPKTQLSKVEVETSQSPYYQIESTKDLLVDLDFNEIDGYSFLSAKNLLDANLNPSTCLEASNPLSEEYQYLRPSLFPDMLLAIAQNPSFSPINFFEIGNIFNHQKEETHLGIIIAGNEQETKNAKTNIENWLNDNQIAENIQKIDQNILNKYKIRKNTVYFIEIPFDQIAKNIKKPQFIIPKMDQTYNSISKFPPATRDLAIIVERSLNAQEITKSIATKEISIHSEITDISAELFDEFAHDRFGENKKSLAFHINYQPTQKTLTNEEVEELHQKIIKDLVDQFNAAPRI